MADLAFDQIEEQLTAALPEIRPAAEYYWKTQGEPGTDCGAYIFFEDMFATYVEVLLALPASPRRDELLRRAFSFVEDMLASSDGNVRDLAFIGLYEGRPRWWFARAGAFIGPRAIATLDEKQPNWRNGEDAATSEPSDEILDGYRVRHVVAHELRRDGVTLAQVPGRTYAQDEPV